MINGWNSRYLEFEALQLFKGKRFCFIKCDQGFNGYLIGRIIGSKVPWSEIIFQLQLRQVCDGVGSPVG